MNTCGFGVRGEIVVDELVEALISLYCVIYKNVAFSRRVA